MIRGNFWQVFFKNLFMGFSATFQGGSKEKASKEESKSKEKLSLAETHFFVLSMCYVLLVV